MTSPKVQSDRYSREDVDALADTMEERNVPDYLADMLLEVIGDEDEAAAEIDDLVDEEKTWGCWN